MEDSAGANSLEDERQEETPQHNQSFQQLFLLRDLSHSKHDTAVGQWGRCFHIYLFGWDMKPKVPSVVQGQMSREKFCSFGTCCVKPSLLFFFFPPLLIKKNPIFWFQYPKKRQQCLWSYLLISEIKKTKYSGKCLILCRLEWLRLLENNAGLGVLKHMEQYLSVLCTSLFSNAALLQQLPSVELQPLSAEAWINSHKCLCEVGMEMFPILIHSGRESCPSFLIFLSSVSSFPCFAFPDSTE